MSIGNRGRRSSMSGQNSIRLCPHLVRSEGYLLWQLYDWEANCQPLLHAANPKDDRPHFHDFILRIRFSLIDTGASVLNGWTSIRKTQQFGLNISGCMSLAAIFSNSPDIRNETWTSDR